MKSNLLKLLSALTIGILIGSCVDLYDPKLKNTQQRLVVESQITTELDYQWVDLTYDAGYNSTETNFNFLVKNAKIWITDNVGNRYDFIDSKKEVQPIKANPGFDYRSQIKFQAVVGRTYQLFIQTENGKQYRSKPELVRAVPKLGKIYTEFKRLPTGFPNPIGEYSVFMDVQDSSTPDEYYRWESIHWEKLIYCQYFTDPNETPSRIYAQPCCQDCYEFKICKECSPIYSDRLTNGKEIKRQLIAKYPYDSLQPYYLRIRQYAISKDVYNFWNTVQIQAQNTGGLFDVTPKQVRGNMLSTNDPNEEVLGYFSASDVDEKVVYLERERADIKPFEAFIPIRFPVCFPCQEFNNRSRVMPKDWIKRR
jgi:hypothetical protein